MTKESFLRKVSFINDRYPKADDKFKARKLMTLCKEDLMIGFIALNKEYSDLSNKFTHNNISKQELKRMNELEHLLNLEYNK